MIPLILAVLDETSAPTPVFLTWNNYHPVVPWLCAAGLPEFLTTYYS